jgi:precorrin-6B methylase 2
MVLSELFNELNDLLWALGLITGSIAILLLMPKKIFLKTWGISTAANSSL